MPLFEETLALLRRRSSVPTTPTRSEHEQPRHGYRDAGKLDRVLRALEETLALRKAKLGPDHPDHTREHEQPRHGLPATPESSIRRCALLEETLALRKAKLGPDHPDTLTS